MTKFKKLLTKNMDLGSLWTGSTSASYLLLNPLKYNNCQCLEINDLWNALHSTFNTVLHHQVDIDILNEITDKPISSWPTFSKEEFRLALANCNNSSAPGPDKLLWSHLKTILKDDDCLNVIISIANACIKVGYWPSHFKRSTMVIIPKPNKKSYDSSKAFRPIALLNIVSKLIEKVIGECLQFNMALNNFIHPSQLSGLKFKSTIDAEVALTHIIRTGWVKNLSMSILAFNIVQFFPSLNHQLLSLIMKKAGFDNWIVSFFTNYLVDRKTNYYLLPFIYILEKHLKN